VNAEQWNAMHPVGTLVFAYPGFRREDDRSARRLVTRTRTKAQISASGDPVVWVDGEGSYICLTHVDPVSESVWQAAKQAEEKAEEKAAAVAAQGALPPPVGDQPQPLDDARLAEIAGFTRGAARLAPRAWMGIGQELLAEVERLKAALSEAADQVAELESGLAEAHQKKAAALASARQLMNRNRTEEAS
jgi:hypothetical protein